MFFHIFTYRLKKLLRTKEMIFWTLAFPILLGTFFNLAFQNLDAADKFNAFPVAVVADAAYEADPVLKDVLSQVSTGEDPLFSLQTVTEKEAEALLEGRSIAGYIKAGSPYQLVVRESGLNQNILRLFLDNLNQTSAAIALMGQEHPEGIPALLDAAGDPQTYTRELPSDNPPPKQILNYFYSLLAMSCMYGAFFGSDEVTDIQANISARAARINVAPVNKLKAFLSSMAASFLILTVNMLILLLFVRFVLGIDFGSKSALVVLTTIVGSLTGASFGAFISALVKKGENLKVAIIITVSMAGSFLAGMMYAEMKFIVQNTVPILAYLNPVNLITDAYYSLYYFSSLERYTLNMAILLLMSVIFSVGTALILRRRKYASI